MTRTRHSSLEMPDAEMVVKEQNKKKQDMISKARSKFFTLGDAWGWSRHDDTAKKSRTQATLDYFFKSCPKEKVPMPTPDLNRQRRASSLQKQHSVDSHPMKIDISDDEDYLHSNKLTRVRPATLCVDKINGEARETAALALERPRKKLSFREPELVTTYSGKGSSSTLGRKPAPVKKDVRCSTPSLSGKRDSSWENLELEVVWILSKVSLL